MTMTTPPADAGIGRRVGVDFAEKDRGGQVVGEPQALIDELGDRVGRGHAALHPIDAERERGQRNRQRHRPAQNLGPEQ